MEGSTLDFGSDGRRFESCRDQILAFGINFYIQIEAKNHKMYPLEQICERPFKVMGKLIFIEIKGQLLSTS